MSSRLCTRLYDVLAMNCSAHSRIEEARSDRDVVSFSGSSILTICRIDSKPLDILSRAARTFFFDSSGEMSCRTCAASRVMILVTDGDNNAGAIDPITASKLAAEMGIRIYTIGIGSDTLILPVQTPFGQQYRQYEGGFDEDLLKRIAQSTGGQYYRAMDAKALGSIFNTINELEKTEFDDKNFKEYNELAYLFMKMALVALSIGVFLDRFYFTQIP